MRIWRFPDQVVRLAIIFIVVAVVMIVVRGRFVPDTFGELGHYRAAAVTANAELPIRYAGRQACIECHFDIDEVKRGSYHRNLSCEGCHGPAAEHVDDPTEVSPAIPGERDGCLYCHEYQFARPTGFPQILADIHNPLESCADCHDPHDPTPPYVPEDCSACHASIARMKAVSHHTSLDCETCHEAPEEHRQNPRAHLPTKPDSREFCGQCHAENAGGAPQIDLETHRPRYVCWQCHYPHYPEAR